MNLAADLDRQLLSTLRAEAGIPHYWIIDLTSPASLTTFTLVDGEYEIADKATGPITLSEPATIAVDASLLTERGYFARDL